LTEADIKKKIDAIFDGTNERSTYVKRIGGRESPKAMEMAYRYLFNSLAKDAATGGIPYFVRLLNWGIKNQNEYQDNKPVFVTDANGIPIKDPKSNKPIHKTYERIRGSAIVAKVGTTDYKLAQISAYRERGIEEWEKGNPIPFNQVYKLNLKEKTGDKGELLLTLPDSGVKWELGELPLVDISDNLKREGPTISITDIEAEYARLKAKSDLMSPEDKKNNSDPMYQSFVIRGSVLYSSRPLVNKDTGEEGNSAKIVLIDEFAVPSIEGVKKSMVTIFCAPGWVDIAGKNSVLQVVGTIKYEKQWGNQMFVEIIFPVIENGVMVLFPPEEEDIKSPVFDPATTRNATETAKSIPQAISTPVTAATSQFSTIPQGAVFNPMALSVPTPPPAQVSVQAPMAVIAQPTIVQAPVQPPAQKKEGCSDMDVDFDPAEELCVKRCPRSFACLNATIAHHSKKMGELPAGSDGQMIVMMKLQKCAAYRKTLPA
jgi:hypothetical protein